MKKRFLPVGLFLVLLFVLSAFLAAPVNDDPGKANGTLAGQTIQTAIDYLAVLRNNQHTGDLNPADIIEARKQIDNSANHKSAKSIANVDWIEMGPDNIGGRTRAVIFDNRDANANTLYAGSVSGGIFKSTNLGSSWSPVDQTEEVLNVSCMVQDTDGTIYVGTGESMNAQNYSGFGTPGFGYSGGFIGKGIYKSDASDDFTLISGTKPVITGGVTEWAYINKLAIDNQGNRLFAATNTGLKYSSKNSLNDWLSDVKYRVDSTIISRIILRDSIITCDSFKIVSGQYQIFGQSSVVYQNTGEDTTNIDTKYSDYISFTSPVNCQDVAISNNGWIIASFNGFVYVSESGNPGQFVNRSVFPNNDQSKRKDIIDYSTQFIIKNKSGEVIHEFTKEYSKEFNWHTNYVEFNVNNSNFDEFPSSGNTGRLSFAIAPSNQNIVYAMATKSTTPLNSLSNVYLSEDKGQSWRVVGPGGSSLLNILGYYWLNNSNEEQYFYQGDYSNTITVFPNQPYKILAGGVNMWVGESVNPTGYYQWVEKSISDASQVFNGIFNSLYCAGNHHCYVFRPNYNNQVFAATDGGIYSVLAEGQLYSFQPKNKNLNITQFYSIGITGEIAEAIGGTQDNGTQYISGKGNTPKKGEDLWRPANLDPKYPEGTDGGGVAISSIRSYKPGIEEKFPPSFYSKSPIPKNEALADSNNAVYRLRRSESLGFDWSINFLLDFRSTVLNNTNFITPMTYWESFNNVNSRDSITFKADKEYTQGDTVIIRSKNLKYPFTYSLPESLNTGDSVRVQDIISTKLFFAIKDNVYMTLQSVRFDLSPDWFKISDKTHSGFMDNPSCIAYSSDCNYVFVGNYEGKVYRISNVAYAYNRNLADVGNPNCIIATSALTIYEGNTQVITSIAVDPKDANKVLVTLGNYANTNYVYYSENALSDTPVFNAVQGNLPPMPVYASVLEMNPDNDAALIGTEEGIWMSDNVSSGIWEAAYTGMGKAPVMALKQQTNSKKDDFTITTYDPATQEPSYEIYNSIKNYGMIYAATFGRGIFRTEKFFTVGEEETPAKPFSDDLSLTVFPNPSYGNIVLNFYMSNHSDVHLNIYDLNGKLMYSENFNGLGKGKQSANIDISSLAEGSYLVQLHSDKKMSSAKLIIVK